jgi:phosphoglycerol transferase MdoB-like AlkP superfamily enzyme
VSLYISYYAVKKMKFKALYIIQKIIFDIFLIILGIILIVLFLLWKDTFDPYNNKIDSSLIPKFEKLRLDE